MKRLYIKPDTSIVDVKTQYQLLAGSDKTYIPGEAGNANEGTSNGGWNSRRRTSIWGDDED